MRSFIVPQNTRQINELIHFSKHSSLGSSHLEVWPLKSNHLTSCYLIFTRSCETGTSQLTWPQTANKQLLLPPFADIWRKQPTDLVNTQEGVQQGCCSPADFKTVNVLRRGHFLKKILLANIWPTGMVSALVAAHPYILVAARWRCFTCLDVQYDPSCCSEP